MFMSGWLSPDLFICPTFIYQLTLSAVQILSGKKEPLCPIKISPPKIALSVRMSVRTVCPSLFRELSHYCHFFCCPHVIVRKEKKNRNIICPQRRLKRRFLSVVFLRKIDAKKHSVTLSSPPSQTIGQTIRGICIKCIKWLANLGDFIHTHY